jgi:DNA-binding beta-propeller fold protein YncE
MKTLTDLAKAIPVYLVILISTVFAQETEELRLLQTIPLPNVSGRMDHLAIDIQSQKLFVAALGNNTVEVLDLHAGQQVLTLTGFSEPQGVVFVPRLNESEPNKLYVTSGGTGLCAVFEGDTLEPLHTLELASDPDNLRYDASRGLVYVGYGNGAIGVMDAVTDEVVDELKLGGHPESFQFEASGSKLFVNIPSRNEIAVLDRDEHRVVTTWSTGKASANYPMALDDIHHRLFIGFRQPALLRVYDTETGNIVADMDSVGDADDIFYDDERGRVYVFGGEGFIDVFEQKDADHYDLLGQIPTAFGARTGLFVPELNRFYVAVPQRGGEEAAVQVYEVLP